MNARNQLNTAYMGGSLVVAGVLGWPSGPKLGPFRCRPAALDAARVWLEVFLTSAQQS